jgi:putative component of toxin-antitoxin plasmid stabilization module
MEPVKYMPGAERYFRKLRDKQLKSVCKAAIYRIRENPHIGNVKPGDLSGIFSLDVYYNGTNYELAYRISRPDNGEIIVVIMAGTRENFYKELKRYIK